MRKVHVLPATGAAAIAHSFTATGRGNHVEKVTFKFGVKPTTSENLTIILNSAAGAAYDVLCLIHDPSTDDAAGDGSLSLIWNGVEDSVDGIDLAPGDSLDIAYANTDTETYGCNIYYTEGTV